MLLDVVDQYDDAKKALFHDLLEKVILSVAQHEDHKKILSFLCKVGIIDINEADKVVTFGVPNEFILTQVKKFFSKSLKEAINETYNPHFTIKFAMYPKFATNHNDLLIDIKKLLNIKADVK